MVPHGDPRLTSRDVTEIPTPHSSQFPGAWEIPGDPTLWESGIQPQPWVFPYLPGGRLEVEGASAGGEGAFHSQREAALCGRVQLLPRQAWGRGWGAQVTWPLQTGPSHALKHPSLTFPMGPACHQGGCPGHPEHPRQACTPPRPLKAGQFPHQSPFPLSLPQSPKFPEQAPLLVPRAGQCLGWGLTLWGRQSILQLLLVTGMDKIKDAVSDELQLPGKR